MEEWIAILGMAAMLLLFAVAATNKETGQ